MPYLNAYFHQSNNNNDDLNEREVGSTRHNDSSGIRKPHFEISKNVNKLYSLMGSREKKERDQQE